VFRLGSLRGQAMARVGVSDGSHSPRSPQVSFKRYFGTVMTHARCAEGEILDWRSPPRVGSGPFAMAVPCARVPGRYAEPRNVKNLVAHPWSWALGSTTSAALRSFDIWSLAVGKPGLSCRSRDWGFEKTADHPWWERHCGQGLVRWAEEPRAARLRKGAGDVKQIEHFRLAQCVTKRNASTSGAGVPVEVSRIRHDWQGCPAHPRASRAILRSSSSGRFLESRARVGPRP
jgi:hypothetical protein